MIVGIAGHRPEKLGGYVENVGWVAWVKAQMRDYLQRVRPLYVISGMAVGVDQWAVEVCIELGIPFIAAIPFPGQEDRWPLAARQKYRALLKRAYEIVVVSEGPYERWKMQVRNEWVVDHCDVLLCVFDGSPGGTANAVLYADRVRREKYRIDPNEFRKLIATGGAA